LGRLHDVIGRARACVRALSLAAALLALPPVTTATPPGALTGTFGGDRVNATFTANGARLDFDCAVAEIDGAVLPDSDGHFVARGRYLAEHSGPIAGDHAPRAVATMFAGWVVGDTLRLELKVTGEPAPRMLTLVRGKRAKLVRCL
jgi:hypothetical protein